MRYGFIALSVVMVLVSTAAFAATQTSSTNCSLARLVSLTFTYDREGRILVPIGVNGTPENFVLDLASERSILSEATAGRLKLPHAELPRAQQLYFENRLLRTGAAIAAIEMGGSSGHDLIIPIATDLLSQDPTVAGHLGLDLLHTFDLELDPAHNKLNLYSQDHCPGRVVYWSKDFVTAPFTMKRAIARLAMTLDGRNLTVGINTARASSYMPMSASGVRWGVDKASPKLIAQPGGVVLSGENFPTYRYPFSELSVAGLSIKYPQIIVYDERGTGRVWNDMVDTECNNTMRLLSVTSEEGLVCGVDLYLGTNEIRQIHSYFAFKENILYVTALDAH